MKIKWLTEKVIEKRAKKSLEEAIKVCIEHHSQIVEAPEDEFLDAYSKDLVNINSEYCGLCSRFNKGNKTLDEYCIGCPLKNSDIKWKDCCDEWYESSRLFDKWYDKEGGTYKDFISAEKKMLTMLKKELKKVE